MKANEDGKSYKICRRVGRVVLDDGTALIFIDLANAAGDIVQVSAEGWKIVKRPRGVRFLRTNSMAALPRPEGGGDLNKLRDFINVEDWQWPLVTAWMSTALSGTGPYFSMFISGGPGDAKSTTCDFIGDMVDPLTSARPLMPDSKKALFAIASSRHLLRAENVESFKGDLWTTFAAIATGTTHSDRELYKNLDVSEIHVQRPILVNGVPAISRMDNIQRAIILSLSPIAKANRKLESDLKKDFAAAQPGMLGALLDRLVKGLATLEAEKARHKGEMPRMADSYLWAAACEGIGLDGVNEFTKQFEIADTNNKRELIVNDPEFRCIIEMVRRGDKALRPREDGKVEIKLPDLLNTFINKSLRKGPVAPHDSRSLNTKLKRAREGLLTVGIAYSTRILDGFTVAIFEKVADIPDLTDAF